MWLRRLVVKALDLQLTVMSSNPCNMAIFRFFKMAAAAILDFFYFFLFLTVGTVQSAEPRHYSKFYRNRSKNGQVGRTVSSGQISSKSLELRPRYGDFSIFKDGGRRHLAFLKFQIFKDWNGQEGRTTSPCQMSLKSVIGNITIR